MDAGFVFILIAMPIIGVGLVVYSIYMETQVEKGAASDN
jgi:hypothetical protein